MFVFWLWACTGAPPTDTDPPTVPDDTAVVHTGDTGPVQGTADTADPLVQLCATPQPIPVPYQVFQGWGSAEDFDIDFQGRHVSVSGSGNLVARDPAGGQTLIAPNVAEEAACTRMLPSGDFVVCNVGENSLVKVDISTGAKTTLVTGMSYPNGGEVDPDGFIYVAEQNAGRIRRIDSNTGDFTVIANNLNNPNGVIFSPDWQTLYVGSFGGGTVYAIDRIGPGNWQTRVFVQDPGQNGGFDGINVDECGNVYVTEFVAGIVWRISPDGNTVQQAVNLPSSWIPNLRWGNGVNGWDERTLYVSDRGQGRLFALDMGLRGKPAFQPPPTP